MRPGYLRKNGIPYSADAVLTEYWDLMKEPNGAQWVVITTLARRSEIPDRAVRHEPELQEESPTGRNGIPRRARRDGNAHEMHLRIGMRGVMATKAGSSKKSDEVGVSRASWRSRMMRPSAPAFAELDLSGMWANRLHEDFLERAPGPRIGDYLGLPINDEGRARADAWQISIQTMPERQCILYTSQYLVMGPQSFKMLPDIDPISGRVTAWRITGTVDRAPHTIWMDGRPHPGKYAAHTAGGFSTGVWEGDMLTVTTTHLKEGMVWRNGVPHSDQATMTEHYARHGTTLTVTMIVDDPIYFEEPFIRSASFQLDPAGRVLPEPCEPQVEIPQEGRRSAALPSGHEPVRRRDGEAVRHSARSRSRRRDDDVSGVPEEDQGRLQGAGEMRAGLRRPARTPPAASSNAPGDATRHRTGAANTTHADR